MKKIVFVLLVGLLLGSQVGYCMKETRPPLQWISAPEKAGEKLKDIPEEVMIQHVLPGLTREERARVLPTSKEIARAEMKLRELYPVTKVFTKDDWYTHGFWSSENWTKELESLTVYPKIMIFLPSSANNRTLEGIDYVLEDKLVGIDIISDVHYAEVSQVDDNGLKVINKDLLHLGITGCPEITAKGIQRFSKLKYLDVSDLYVDDKFISKLPLSIEVFKGRNCESITGKDSPFKKFNKLKKLDLTIRTTDPKPKFLNISSLPKNLIELILDGRKIINEDFSELNNLKKLGLSEIEVSEKTISSLKGLDNLIKLDLTKTKNLENNWLYNIPKNINTLNLGMCENIGKGKAGIFLKEMRLYKLSLKGTKVTNEDIKLLPNTLGSLDLSDCKSINKLADLRHLIDLKTVNFVGSSIDRETLRYLPKTKHLLTVYLEDYGEIKKIDPYFGLLIKNGYNVKFVFRSF